MINRRSLIIFSVIVFGIQAFGQTLTDKNIELPADWDSEVSSYIARDYIKLNPGFSFSGSTNSLILKTDETLVFNADYLKETEIIYPAERSLDKNLDVGTTKGNFNVTKDGAAVYSILIAVSPGTRGMQPKISINYNSKGRKGLLGYGWSLSGISAITRTKKDFYHDKKVEEITLDNNDVFALDGQRLVKTSTGEYGGDGTVYGKTIEDFSRITSYGDIGGGPKYFVVETKDGTKLYYGNAETGAHANRVHNSTSVVISWYLYKIEDIHGNYMIYNYTIDESIGEILLNSIKYTGNAQAGITPFNEIKIFYDARSDANEYYAGNCKITDNKIIRSIKSYCNGDLFRKYEPTYFFDTYTYLNELFEYNAQGERFNSLVFGLENKQEPAGWQNLHTFENKYLQTFADFNGDGLEDLCELVEGESSDLFDYKIVVSTYNKVTNTYEKSYETMGFKNTEVIYPGDFNGDGLADLICVNRIEQKYKIIQYLNTNGKIFPDLTNIPEATVNTVSNVPEEGNYPRYYVSDYNGDNISDLLVYFPTTHSNWIYLGNETGDLFKTRMTSPINGYLEDAKLTDFNGDGRTDILFKTDTGNKIISISDDGSPEELAVLNDLTSEYVPMDANGDGRSELVRIDEGKITGILEYIPSGFISSEVPDYSVDYSGEYEANSFDITGDGKDELVISGNDGTNNNLEVLMFQDGKFVQLEKMSNLSSKPFRIMPVDYNGNGSNDICFVNFRSLYISDLGESLKPLKINSIANGLNQLIEITYGYSSDTLICKHNEGGLYPVINLPFSLQLVESYSIDNGNGGKTGFNYSYSDPKVNLKGLGFLGFASFSAENTATTVIKTNTIGLDTNFHIPGIYSFIVTTNTGDTISKAQKIIDLAYADPDSIRIYNKLKTLISNDNLKDTYYSTDYTWDDNGNVVYSLTDNNGEGSVSQTTHYSNHGTTFASHPDDFTLTVSLQGEPEYTRTRHFIYDGLNLERIVTDQGDDKEVTVSFDYYSTGDLKRKEVTASDAGTQYEEYTYDDKFRFPETKTITGEFVTSSTYDEITGNPLSSTNIYGTTISYYYNNWGMLTGSSHPVSGSKTISQDWADGDLGNDFVKITTSGDGIPTSIVYKDILGRTILEEAQKFEGDNVYVKYQYNDDGTLYRYSQPYESTASDWNTLTYDSFGRVTGETGPGYDMAFTYSGLATTLTNNINGNKKTTVKNGLGLVDEITDPGGTINYSYYSSGKIKEISSPDGTTSFEYDLLGNTTKTVSLNAGTSSATYNSLGQLLTATNAKSQTTNYYYDSFGRLDYFTNIEGTTDYTYISGGNGLGQIESILGPSGHVVNYSYDNYGRAIGYNETIDGADYPFTYNYDNLGRIESMEYPSGFIVNYSYNNRGYLETISNGPTNIWALNATDKLGNITGFGLGNGLSTSFSYNDMGQITDIETGTIQDLRYSYNSKNLLQYRFDDLKGISEQFTYDNLNRLTSYTVSGDATYQVKYATNGNIESKSGIGTYAYNDTGHPNAVTEISANGEFLPSSNQDITYNYFNKIETISEDLNTLNIEYGIDGSRRKTTLMNNGNLEKTKIFVGPYEKEILADGTIRELNYIDAPSGVAAIYELTNGSGGEMFYVHADHLGSFDKITDGSGAVVEEYSFDPWGQRRNPDDWTYTNVPVGYLFDRGFTGHEHLDEFNLINMNGRAYDPKLARFLSPDPVLQAPGYTQNYNGYAYCFNNPLHFTDPSGYIGEPVYDFDDMNDFVTTVQESFMKDDTGGSGTGEGNSSKSETNNTTSSNQGFTTGSNSVLDFIQMINEIIKSMKKVDAKDYAHINVYVIFTGGKDASMIFDNTGSGLELHSMNFGITPTVTPSSFENGMNATNSGGDGFNSLYYLSKAVPVAVSLGTDIDFVTGTGSDIAPINVGFVLRGDDRGKFFTFGDFGAPANMRKINGWAFGLDISAAAEATVYWYTGDINNFNIKSFNGTRMELNIGGSFLIDAAVGWTVSAPDEFGGRIIGIKQAWGVGWSPFMLSGNLNRGQTTVY